MVRPSKELMRSGLLRARVPVLVLYLNYINYRADYNSWATHRKYDNNQEWNDSHSSWNVRQKGCFTEVKDVLVNMFVSTVNLTIFTKAVSWKNPSASFRLLVSWLSRSKVSSGRYDAKNVYVINHRGGDKNVWNRGCGQPDLNASTVSRTGSVGRW
jgi:hypothetical protein